MWTAAALPRSTHGSGVFEPLLRGDHRDTERLRACVVLLDDRAHPLDHAVLDRHRTGGGRVDDPLQARHIESGAGLVREMEHPDEVSGDELCVGDRVLLDGAERRGCIETLHDDRGGPDPMDRRGEPDRCGVIQRRRAEVHGVLVGAVPRRHQHRDRVVPRSERRVGQRPDDALRVAGRPGGVEHERAGALVRTRYARRRFERVLETVVAVDRLPGHQPGEHVRSVGEERCGDVGEV